VNRWPGTTLSTLSRDKQDTLLLIASALLVLAPHAAHLPPWVTLLCAGTLAWRAFVTLRGRRMPPNRLLVPIALAAMAGVAATYHTLLGRDAGVAMLVLLVAFKMLEMHARRDLFVVVFLCFFLVLTNFFYSQSIVTALLMLVSIVLLLTTQLSFQLTGAVPPLRTRLLMGARMLLLAAPLAAGAFVLFPRIEGPLWGLPDDHRGARTGLSDSMAPGQVAQLAQSEDVAFRVKFEGPVPAQPLLYWRGPVLGRYDGITWTRLPPRPGRGQPSLTLSVDGAPTRYAVTLEPSGARWLLALEMPQALPVLPGHDVLLSGELEIESADPLGERVRYAMASYPRYRLQADGDSDGGIDGGIDRGDWLLLPFGRNPRTLDEGRRLASIADPARRVAAALTRFSRDGFVYTLRPPLLPGPDGIDDFLYKTRAGFCEHYAGAFVFLMRAAGVPARVVTGYQGGELNPIDGYLTVRQSDAHAWAEVWLARQGWVRVDPTAAAAPERVRRSLARALPSQPPFGFGSLGRLLEPSDPDALPSRIRYLFGAANNGWNQWVLNYGVQRQQELLERLRDGILRWQTLALLAALSLLLLAGREFVLRRRRDPVDALYSALCRRLAQLGLPRAPDEGPVAYAARIAAADLPPGARTAAADFLRRYSAWRYGPPGAHAGLLTILKQLLSRVR
jgi:transglutaminase-like putative cysteine protease